MNISPAGFALIRKWEGWVPYLYDDDANNATVGFGILVHEGPVHVQRGICASCDHWPRQTEAWLTEEQGLALLDQKIHGTGLFAGGQNYAGAVEWTFRPLNQNEFDALVDFAYNLGTGTLVGLKDAVDNHGDVCAELRRYVNAKVDGVLTVLPGLVSRREEECALFNTPEEDMKPMLVWTKDSQRWYLVGPWGASWITNGEDVTTLEGLYGKGTVVLHESTLHSIATVAVVSA